MNNKPIIETYTLEEFVEAGKSVTVTYNNLSYIETISNGTLLPIFNVLNDYIEDLLDFCMTIELSDEEYIKYKYKPKLLAYDMYGNTELYFVILLLNNMCNIKDFTKHRLKMLPKTSMTNLMSYIYNAEKDLIDAYNS